MNQSTFVVYLFKPFSVNRSSPIGRSLCDWKSEKNTCNQFVHKSAVFWENHNFSRKCWRLKFTEGFLTLSPLHTAFVWSKTMNGRVHCSYSLLKGLFKISERILLRPCKVNSLVLRPLFLHKNDFLFPQKCDEGDFYFAEQSINWQRGWFFVLFLFY